MQSADWLLLDIGIAMAHFELTLAEAGVRVVPPGTVRYGAFCEPGVVLMPGYVNIGARVGDACRQSGAKVGALHASRRPPPSYRS